MIKNKKPLMPKGTACWLKMNTSLSLQQIADFCNMTTLEVELVSSKDCFPYNPVELGQLTDECIKKCETNSKLKLKLACEVPQDTTRTKYIDKKQRDNFLGYLKWFSENQIEAKVVAKLLRKQAPFITKKMEEVSQLDITPIDPRDGNLLSAKQVDELLLKRK